MASIFGSLQKKDKICHGDGVVGESSTNEDKKNPFVLSDVIKFVTRHQNGSTTQLQNQRCFFMILLVAF